MKHEFFLDGTTKKISWVIQTGGSKVEQTRQQAEIYLNKVNDEQAKYIALHVGIFWGIGTFIIKNEDSVTVKIDSKSMYDHLANNSEISDPFIQTRSEFIKRLIEQRKLDVQYNLIEPTNNPASKLL